jgi:ABC-type uncharacterized transport system ATPase subunit
VPDTARVPLIEELLGWVEQQPAWQQELAVRLLSRPELTGDDYDEALRVVLAAHAALRDGEDAPEPSNITSQHFPEVSTAIAPRLLSFGRMRGVGAVDPEGELEFGGDGLTTVFGANAAGKSTYVRGLKQVCRTVDLDRTLLGNVFAEAEVGEQTATLTTATGHDAAVGRRVDLQAPDEPALSMVSVFDARCAEVYVDEDNAVAYVPSALRLLARMAAVQDGMRGDVDRMIAEARAAAPRFDDDLPVGTRARERVDALGVATAMPELESFASLNDAERARETELQAAVATADARQAQDDALAAEREAGQADALGERLGGVVGALAPEAVERLRTAAREASAAREAADTAAREFAGLPVPGVGGEPWRRMWEAARGFVASEQLDAPYPPAAGQHCPYCLQELGVDTADRLAHLERHTQSELTERADTARGQFEAAVGTLDQQLVDACRGDFLTSLAENATELHSAIETFLTTAEDRLRALRENPAGAAAPPLPEDPRDALRRWAEGRRGHAQTLRAAADPEGAARLRSELNELTARAALERRMQDARVWVAELRRIEALQAARRDLNTNRVTRCQSDLSRAAVTDVLEANLRRELTALRCGHIPVELNAHGAAGETMVALRLAGAAGAPQVSDILSEGEQRALSLAFFFAEVATAEHDGGIVVDDPVSSLDDERRAYIAQRLAQEGQRRQAIVFTHDLPFVVDLIEQAKKLEVSSAQQWVWREGADAGRVDDDPPFAAMNFRQRVGALSNRVQEWDRQVPAADQDEARRRVESFYRDMRTAWERGVEQRLFAGVVQRFQREVKTQSLGDVNINADLVRAVEDGMTRCSRFLHDAAEGTLTAIPDRQDLAADLDPLVQFERESRRG